MRLQQDRSEQTIFGFGDDCGELERKFDSLR